MVHLNNGMLLHLKTQGNFTFSNSMDGPGEHYVGRNKPVRERQVLYDFIHMWSLINKIN